MRSPHEYRLSFLLPPGARAEPGVHQPSGHGCAVRVTRPLAEIAGPSREAVFDQAARLVRIACRGLGPLSISAVLMTPSRPSGRDSWQIIVGADVSFAPTAIDAAFPNARPPPCLELVDGRGGA